MSKFSERFGEGGFKSWFVNVYWFHYRWLTVAIVAALALIVFMTVDALRQTKYDATVVIAAQSNIDPEDIYGSELDKLLCGAIGDLDGNGTAAVEYAALYMGDDELGQQNRERIYIYLVSEQYVIYLFDKSCAELYCAPELGYFDPVEDYGITSDEDSPYTHSLSDSPVMQRMGLESLKLAILDHSTATGEQVDIDRTESCVAMAKALLEAE